MKFTSVKERILVAFFVYSTISFAVSTTSFFLFGDLEDVDNATSEVNNLYNQILDGLRIGQQFFAYEINDEEFYLTGSSESVNEHRKIIADVLITLDDLQHNKEAKDLEMSNDLAKLDLLLRSYNELYQESLDLVQERGFKDQGLVGEMRRQIHEVEEAMVSEKELILSLRRSEKDYFLRNDTSYVFQVVNLNEQLREKILLTKDVSDFKRRRLTSLVNRYYNTFLRIVDIDRKLGFKASNEVTGGNAIKLKSKIQEISASIQAINTKTNDEKFDINTRVKVILVVIVTLSVILTLFLSLSFKFVLEDGVDSIEE